MSAKDDTEAWITANEKWLTDDHRPMVGQLRAIAAVMDSEGLTAALANAQRMAYRTLMEVKHLGERTDPTGGEGGLFGPAGDPGTGF